MRVIVSVLLALSLSAIAQLAHADFRDNGDGTVTDLSLNLMWQHCTAPSEDTSCVSGLPSTYIWDDALAYCNALSLGGQMGWRLPNVKELHSIVDMEKVNAPNIDTTYFPDTQAAYYWSSTTFFGTSSYAWYVNFNLVGSQFVMTSGVNKLGKHYARCVRGE